MAKKRLTPRQKEWEIEYARLERRARSWVEKFHAVADLPERPKRITKEAIEKLRNIKWAKVPESVKKQWREEYEKRYEEGQEGVYFPKAPYVPPSESDWVKAPRPEPQPPDQHIPDESPDEDGWTDTVDSRAEIEAWIERTIDSIVIEETDRQREVPGVRQQLWDLVLNAADSYGDYIGYLAYLEEHAGELTKYAELALTGYFNPWRGTIIPVDDQALPQFATILNFNRPLSKEQSDALSQGGNAYWSPFYNQ